MHHCKNWLRTIAVLAPLAVVGIAAVDAQQLWKYVDKDGKVTYSDKAPKPGEKAEAVKSDPKVNVLDAPRNTKDGASQTLKDINARTAEKADKRDKLRNAVDEARAELDAAKKALDEGRDPLPSEVQIVVGRNKDGAPTGKNASIRKPEYYARIAELEEEVKKAEAALEIAERNQRRGSP